MGYFIIDTSEKPTVESSLQTAIANIELYKEQVVNGNMTYDYLITGFATNYLEKAIKLLTQEKIEQNKEGKSYDSHLGYKG